MKAALSTDVTTGTTRNQEHPPASYMEILFDGLEAAIFLPEEKKLKREAEAKTWANAVINVRRLI